MKNLKNYKTRSLSLHVSIVAVLTSIIFISCQKDNVFGPNESFEIQNLSGPNIEDGRMSFLSKENLTDYINSYKNKSDQEFASEILLQESKGFSSLMIVAPKAQEDKLKARLEAQSQNRDLEDEIDLDEDEIVSDDSFAAVLNEDREIMVDGIIYKYTEKGLFFAPEEQYEMLISEYNGYQMGSEVGETSLGNGVFRYVPDSDNGDVANLVFPTEDPSPPGPPTNGGDNGGDDVCDNCEYDLLSEIENLDLCGATSLIDLFGTSRSCKVKFNHNNKKRVKTKFTATNYIIFTSIGHKVKIQRSFKFLGKTCWTNNNIEADILELGFEDMEYEYDWTPPGINVPSAIPTRTIVRYANISLTTDPFTGQIISYQGQNPHDLFENFPFQNGTMLEIYIPGTIGDALENLGFDREYALTDNDFNNYIENLSEQAILWILNETQLVLNGDVTVVVPQADQENEKFIFTYRNYSKRDCNENRLEKIWEWETATVGFQTNFNGNTSPIFSSPNKYNVLLFDGYGIGKEDGCNFAGSKMYIRAEN